MYSWQGGGLHNYFYTSYYDQTKMTVPSVDGFEVVKVWDEHGSAARVLSKVLYGKSRVCKTFAEVSGDVDLVFIADCNGDGRDHLKLSQEGILMPVLRLAVFRLLESRGSGSILNRCCRASFSARPRDAAIASWGWSIHTASLHV